MDNLVYNRESPVYINIEDLNRIEQWTQFLANTLTSLGYEVYIETKTWTLESIPWQEEIDRIRRNIVRLQDKYRLIPEWREITFTNSLNFTQVNAMEWDLQMIYRWLSRMVAGFSYSGEFFSGEGVMA